MDRLQKIIAAAGLASRRQAEELILAGHVRVNGNVIRDLGSKADLTTDTILVHNRPLPKPKTTTYIVNKPRGVVCSLVRQDKETLITELVPPYPRVFPIGRLDKESEGLILLTNDGELSQKLTHPSFGHTKEYYVRAHWEKKATQQSADWLERQLVKGVRLGDGNAKADKVKVKLDIQRNIQLEIVVHEGRKHLIRRMCATLGLEVTSLRRTRFATLSLDRLKPGSWRILTDAERQSLE